MGQIADSTALEEVQVQAQRFSRYQTGFHYTKLDSSKTMLMPAATLGRLLQSFTPIHIRSYGPSGIATPSFRGTGAEHTAVLWNGFNISNAMLGQFNFATMPTLAIDDIQIQHGGNGALFGSGAIGGTIMLNNSAQFNSGLKATTGLTVGSFGLWQPILQFSFGNTNKYIKISYQKQVAQNNYPFTNQGIVHHLTHAKTISEAISASSFWRVNKKHLLKINALWIENNNQIPATIQSGMSNATQYDRSVRLGTEWNYNNNRYAVALRSGIFGEQMNYQNINTQLFSPNYITNWITEAELQRNWKQRLYFTTGANYTLSTAQSIGYTNNITQHRGALFYAAQFKHKRMSITQSTRIEHQDNTTTPLIPLLGVEYKIARGWTFAGNASRGYRLPTLNERFWTPGGNPNLLPEDSYGGDIGIGQAGHVGNFCWQIKALYFYRNINQRIIWLPSSGFPTAVNIRAMNTQGIETQWKAAWMVNKNWNLDYTSQLNYTHAINQTAISANDAGKGKQLIFVPRVGQQHHITATYRSIQFSGIAQYTGMRFASTDNLEMLDDYLLMDVIIGKTVVYKKHKILLQMGAFNLTNRAYATMPDRPMPGRNYQFTILFHLQQQIK
jgi:iron complex outermembrane receptor protein